MARSATLAGSGVAVEATTGVSVPVSANAVLPEIVILVSCPPQLLALSSWVHMPPLKPASDVCVLTGTVSENGSANELLRKVRPTTKGGDDTVANAKSIPV